MTRRTTSRVALAALLLTFCGAASACVLPPLPEEAGEIEVNAEASISVGRMADLTWVAVEIDGVPVDSDAGVWLTVSSTGQASGNAGCNSFAGQADLDAGVMEFGPLRVTRMACEPARMDIENRFLDALGSVTAFAVDPDGTLALSRPDGSVALRFRP